MKKILIVDDTPRTIANPLDLKDYRVDFAHNISEGFDYLSLKNYDLLIGDLNLQEQRNLDLFKFAKLKDASIRLLVLAAHPNREAELEALSLGVDFYLEKTISNDALKIYIDKILDEKRGEVTVSSDDLYSKAENIKVLLRSREVYKDDVVIPLSPKEYDVLKLLLENKSEILTRQAIVDSVWSCDHLLESSRIVDVHIQKLRDKLQTFAISTIRGVGYKWNE